MNVANRLSPETVQVQLLKSVAGSPGAFEPVGTLTQSVSVTASRAVPFVFSYRFTAADAAQGRVTFEAIATIVGGRDAQPAGNTVIPPATVVNP